MREPVELAFEIQKDKDRFRLVGRVKTVLQLPCSRCLEGYSFPVEAAFDMRYWPVADASEGTETEVGEEDLDGLVENALALRKPLLADASTDAFRVIHSDGDGLSGLVVDRFADVLSIEVHSLGMAQRIGRWIPRLHAVLGTKRALFDVDPQIARMEGIGEIGRAHV